MSASGISDSDYDDLWKDSRLESIPSVFSDWDGKKVKIGQAFLPQVWIVEFSPRAAFDFSLVNRSVIQCSNSAEDDQNSDECADHLKEAFKYALEAAGDLMTAAASAKGGSMAGAALMTIIAIDKANGVIRELTSAYEASQREGSTEYGESRLESPWSPCDKDNPEIR